MNTACKDQQFVSLAISQLSEVTGGMLLPGDGGYGPVPPRHEGAQWSKAPGKPKTAPQPEPRPFPACPRIVPKFW